MIGKSLERISSYFNPNTGENINPKKRGKNAISPNQYKVSKSHTSKNILSLQPINLGSINLGSINLGSAKRILFHENNINYKNNSKVTNKKLSKEFTEKPINQISNPSKTPEHRIIKKK